MPRSSFILRLGSGDSGQIIRVLPSTSTEVIWTVSTQDSCPDGWPGGRNDCIDRRGGVYDRNKSATYQYVNSYGLEKVAALKNYGLEYEGVRSSFENITLDYPQSSGAPMGKNIIWEFTSWNYTLQGLVGLHQAPINLTDLGGFSYSNPSFIQTLKDSNKIPSVSYGYTAGAIYGTYPPFFPVPYPPTGADHAQKGPVEASSQA
jgi:hypothetical protein